MSSDELKKWVQTWEGADSRLRAVRAEELQEDSYYQCHRHALHALLCYAYDHRTVRRSSGLVEQQRLFKSLYSQTTESR